MAVFVDRLRVYGLAAYHGADTAQAIRVGEKHGHRWCHMFADTREELFALAVRIGMRREWFQEDRSGGHFDLNPTRRRAAVKAGAVEVTDEQAVAIWRRARSG